MANNNIEQMASQFLGADSADKLAGKEGDINQLLNSSDGRKIKSMVSRDAGALKKAVADGDTEKLQSTLSSILSTEEGARLAKQLKDMMK